MRRSRVRYAWFRNRKECFKKTIEYIRTIFSPYFGAASWTNYTLVGVASLIIALMCQGTGLPFILEMIILFFVSFLLLSVVRILVLFLLRPLHIRYLKVIVNLLILIITLVIYLDFAVGDRIELMTQIYKAIWVSLLLYFTTLSIYAIIVRKNRKVFILIISLCCMGGQVYLFSYLAGVIHGVNYLETIANLRNRQYDVASQDPSIYAASLKKGEYNVATVTYGREGTLPSDKVNLRPFVNHYDGIREVLRNHYWGFSIEEVPLTGKVWYPEGKLECPILFIIHGNHAMTTPSYQGYEYLASHLASRGYIVVSVDENVLNYYIDQGLSGENDARAVLLLENIAQMEKYNQMQSSPLYQKIDMEKIALAGHSRGGEAVALAYLFNTLRSYPDNDYYQFNYRYNISSLIAIAPSVNQYYPAGKEVLLKDVNYLLLHGSNDQDVNSFMGVKQYNQISFTGGKECFKSYLYIGGANHGQFNTTWNYDTQIPFRFLYEHSNLIPGVEQREIATGFITAFLDTTLLGQKEKEELFYQYYAFRDSMPDTIYQQAYSNSSRVILADYEEDIKVDTITYKEAEAEGKRLYLREQKNSFLEGSHIDKKNYAVYLSFSNLNSEYELQFEETEVLPPFAGMEYLQFDVANRDVDAVLNEEFAFINFGVVIEDGYGEQARVDVLEYANLYPVWPVCLYKVQHSLKSYDMKSEYQTVRIPISAFVKKNAKLNLTNIMNMRFVFDKVENGQILVDNIELTK